MYLLQECPLQENCNRIHSHSHRDSNGQSLQKYNTPFSPWISFNYQPSFATSWSFFRVEFRFVKTHSHGMTILPAERSVKVQVSDTPASLRHFGPIKDFFFRCEAAGFEYLLQLLPTVPWLSSCFEQELKRFFHVRLERLGSVDCVKISSGVASATSPQLFDFYIRAKHKCPVSRLTICSIAGSPGDVNPSSPLFIFCCIKSWVPETYKFLARTTAGSLLILGREGASCFMSGRYCSRHC